MEHGQDLVWPLAGTWCSSWPMAWQYWQRTGPPLLWRPLWARGVEVCALEAHESHKCCAASQAGSGADVVAQVVPRSVSKRPPALHLKQAMSAAALTAGSNASTSPAARARSAPSLGDLWAYYGVPAWVVRLAQHVWTRYGPWFSSLHWALCLWSLIGLWASSAARASSPLAHPSPTMCWHGLTAPSRR